jgi:DNA-binding IclR family transcriptional regulator
MHISPVARRLLNLVFGAVSAALTRPRLERLSGLSRAELNRALDELGRLGLVDPRRLRLTLPGLALAAAFGARSKPKAVRRPAASVARAPIALNAPMALFSRREAPRAVA